MGRYVRPSRVYQTMKTKLSIPRTNPEFKEDEPMRIAVPVWLRTIERIPPSELLTRPNPTPHHDPDPRRRLPSKKFFKPQRIEFPEDELRRNFFRDHPWELARPRIAVELDGKDAWYVDWGAGIKQPGMQVTGESVVQRQLWLMENGTVPERVFNEATGDWETINKPMTKEQAYDMARKEFYLVRQREEIQRRIATEEARFVGAYFNKSRLQISMEVEDRTYDRWRSWAEIQSAKVQAERESAYANFGNEDSLKTLAEGEVEDEAAAP